MSKQTVQADYLVVGSGAMGMAFSDVLMTETDATIAIVDRHHQPGGHWNDAYPHVRLHQPSAFYGVNSKNLGSDTIDATGWNKGLYELATNSEVCAYFDQVMQQQFLPSGRVQYFPMCESTGDGNFKSLVADTEYHVVADKVVDATYMNVTVPSMREPDYALADGVHCAPTNTLPRVAGQYDNYVVIGAGKTGMDACLFLLKNGVDPDNIQWIMPRDSWMLDRANIQPGKLFATSIGRGFVQQAQAMAEATTIEDLLVRVADTGQLIRFDENVWPTMYRCATVTHAELEQLRRIRAVIRMGRVQRIEQDEIILDQGKVATNTRTLHVDCSADGLQRRPIQAVFEGNKITLQSVRTCQQVFSAAFIGHIEANYADEHSKNELCTPVPHPDSEIDFLRTSLANNLNGATWAADPALQQWLLDARLDGFTSGDTLPDMNDPEVASALENMQKASINATNNLQSLLADYDAQ
jgi:hypothetical protein